MRQVGHFIRVLCIDQLKSARGHSQSILNLKSNYFSNKENIFYRTGGGGCGLLQAAGRGGPLPSGQPRHLLQPPLRQGAARGAGALGAQNQHD